MYKKINPQIAEPDIIMYTDIVYSNPFNDYYQSSIPLSLHLLRPFYKIDEWEKRPLLVWIGGGGFQSSTPARSVPELMEYARQGYVVASIGYRVSGTTHFPSQVQDVKAAIRFLKHYHEKYGIDPDQVVVAGHSAGSYLAAMAGVTGDEGMFGTDEWNDVSSSVKAVVCMSGGDLFLDDPAAREQMTKQSVLEIFLGYPIKGNAEKVKTVSPSQYMDKNTPPFLLIHGEKDEVVPVEFSRVFYEKLTKAGVNADFYEIEGAGHETVELWQPEIKGIIINFFKQALEA